MERTARQVEPAGERSLPGFELHPVEAGQTAPIPFPRARSGYEWAKRLLDVALALPALAVAAPLMTVAAAAVTLSSPGEILHRQTRIGRHGRPFTCYKLRTMVDGAKSPLEVEELQERFAATHKLHDDPRVTRVGRVLRKMSLDELPQLWNVLRGEMSMVGPRPYFHWELDEMYRPFAEAVTSVRPGLTGLWQVSGRSSLPYERRVELDMEYVARRSVLLDISIVLRTPIVLLSMRGAI